MVLKIGEDLIGALVVGVLLTGRDLTGLRMNGLVSYEEEHTPTLKSLN
jgi:hypothetical protein